MILTPPLSAELTILAYKNDKFRIFGKFTYKNTLENFYGIGYATNKHYERSDSTTPAQMKMFLTRIGFGSKVIVTGDMSQRDLPGDGPSGLDVAVRVLHKIDDIAIVRLSDKDIVRHPLVQKIVQAYERYETRNKERERKPGGNR